MHSRDWLGRPVLGHPARRRLGEVSDVLLDAAGRQIVGIVMRTGSWLGGQRVVPLAAVRESARDGIVVDEPPGGFATLSVERTWGQLRDLAGKRLLSEAGDELGLLDDISFNPQTGQVQGFRLSAGFVSDWLDGRTRLRARVEAVAGDHVVVGVDGPETRPGDRL